MGKEKTNDIRSRSALSFAPMSCLPDKVSRFSSEQMDAWLWAVIESATNGVILTDARHRVVLISNAAQRLFGYPVQQVLGQPVDRLLSAQTRDAHRNYMDRCHASGLAEQGGTGNRIQLECIRASGEVFPITALISRIAAQGELFLAVIITESIKSGTDSSYVPAPAPASPVRRRGVSSQQANEVEKRRVSRELYDDLGQHLSVLKLDMDWLENSLPNVDKLCPARIKQMQSLLDNIIVRTKSIASSLRPPLLDDFGLLPAVKWVADNFNKRTSIQCEVESKGMAVRLGDPVDSAIYRVVQEALLNIERHSHASHVKIRLWHSGMKLDVIIEDDGVGMVSGSENKAGCFGLVAMQERIYTLGGTIKIKNLKPRGLVIHASTPVESFPLQISTS
ncbi:MAG: hypothetical protein JWQ23_3218 [Herminiimonas sp.]|nr:hypothetical protein [Herminiimonas sp.]